MVGEPRGELAEASLDVYLGTKVEQLGCPSGIADAVADVASAVATDQLGLDREVETLRETLRDIEDARGFTRADIERRTGGRRLGCEVKGARHVGDVHEIAGLQAVFKGDWRMAVE